MNSGVYQIEPGSAPGAAWLRQMGQSAETMRAVYVAHQLAGPLAARNRLNASEWCGRIAKEFLVSVSANWIVLSGQWPETPENRELGLRCDFASILRCNELWLVGGRVSPGMAQERDFALRNGVYIRDLTSLGYEVPRGAIVLPEAA